MRNSLRQFAAKIAEINARYREPRIAMSGAVRAALLALRIYLVLLVGLLLFKFVALVS